MAVGLHMQAVFQRTRVLGAEDVAVCTFDLFHDTATDFPVAEIVAVGDAFVTFWINIRNDFYTDNVLLRELRFYDDYNGDGSPGLVDVIRPVGLAGAAPGVMCPPQVAISVTEMLGPGSRRSWGRFYLPSPAVSVLADDGTLAAARVDQLANEVETLYDAWRAGDRRPVVWVSPGTGPPDAVTVQQIRVDEILDVQRRRRWESTQIRQTRTIE